MSHLVMSEFVEKFRDLEKEIADEKGDFRLFALVLREEAPNRWDLLVSAPWANDDPIEPLKYLADQIKSRVKARDLINLSRIIVLRPSEESVKRLNREFSVKHGKVEVRDTELLGRPIKQAFILTSQRRASRVKHRAVP